MPALPSWVGNWPTVVLAILVFFAVCRLGNIAVNPWKLRKSVAEIEKVAPLPWAHFEIDSTASRRD